jgi:hypothetical protein
MLKKSRLPTYPDGRVEIERELLLRPGLAGPDRLGLDEAVEPVTVTCLGVAVKQEGGMVWVGQASGMEFLEVGREVVYPLRVKELRKSARWLNDASDGPCG